jgi:AcrR family transcriptional regulator
VSAEPAAVPPPRRGPSPKATRDEVLAAATRVFAAGRPVDVQAVAVDLGVGRATVYRWFGSREGLLTEVLVGATERLVADARARTTGRGARALLATFDTINQRLAGSAALRRFVQEERPLATRLFIVTGGPVQQRTVALIRALIEERVGEDGFTPPVDPDTLAYAVVRLAEAFLFNDAIAGAHGDVDRLRDLEAALLGLGRSG